MEKTVLVKSSSRDDPYAVSVLLKETDLSIFCDCPAGEWGKYCKHKMAIVLRDEKVLYDDEQTANFAEIGKWIAKSDYPKLVSELRESETELEAAKKRVKGMKDQIARAMKAGLPYGN